MSSVGFDTNHATSDSRVQWPMILLLVMVALGLRLYRLDQQSLWIDEVSSVEVARQPLREIVLNYRPGRHPWHGAEQAPLSFLLMNLAFSPANQEASARFPSVLCGVAAVLVIFQLARELMGGSIALISAALLALSPLHIWYSQEARWYTLWILLTASSYWMLLRCWRQSSAWTWAGYALLTTLNIYTFVLSFLVMASQGFSALLLARQRGGGRFVATMLAAQVVAVVAAAPVFWLILNTLGLTTGTPRPQVMVQIPYALFVYAAGYSIGPTVATLHALPSATTLFREQPAILIFFAIFTPLLMLGLAQLRRFKTPAIILVPWLAGPLLLTGLLALISHVTFQVRYSSAALPAFLIVLAIGVHSIRPALLRWSAMTAVFFAFALSLANHYWNPTYFKEDARNTAAFLAANDDGAPIFVVGQVGPAVKHYDENLQVTDIDGCNGGWQVADDKPVWLVVGRDWQTQGPECVARLSALRPLSQHRTFPGIEVWLFGSARAVSLQIPVSTVQPRVAA